MRPRCVVYRGNHMRVRRLVSVIAISSIVWVTAVIAQPKAGAPATPPAAAGSAQGSGSAAPADDAPPADMEGTDENPGAPKTGGEEEQPKLVKAAEAKPTGYPDAESQRPITLPEGMSEVMLDIHAQVSPFTGAAPLRARYGITKDIQLGLTWVTGAIYEDPTVADSTTKVHPGRAVGLDVTVMLKKWMGVRVGVPIYVQPFALSVAAGVPMKFVLSEKLALGGLDDVLNIAIHKFAPSYYHEVENQVGKFN